MSDTNIHISHPGELIREEVEGRGWALSDLAKIIDRPLQLVSEIVNGKRGITPITARELGEALGTGPEFWMNLQSLWELSQVDDPQGRVRQRAAIYEMAPIREMVQRGWIRRAESPEDLSRELQEHYEVDDLGEVPQLLAAARAAVSGESDALTPAQWAWCCRSHKASSLVTASRYRKSNIGGCVEELRRLMGEPEEIRSVSAVLAEAGIRLVIVQHLSKTKLDGAALRRNASEPVISLSLRHGRIDNFWFTLMHELAHIKYGDGICADVDTTRLGGNIDSIEERANLQAADWLVPRDQLDSFIRRTSPLYSARRVSNFARRMGVHPGIVVGQLKFYGGLDWGNLTRMQIQVRDIVKMSNITDGWGTPAPIDKD